MDAEAKSERDKERSYDECRLKMKKENISAIKKFHNFYILLPEFHGIYTQVAELNYRGGELGEFSCMRWCEEPVCLKHTHTHGFMRGADFLATISTPLHTSLY